jgi:4-hydroxy-3-polyprenylbenzoate decarboxylase
VSLCVRLAAARSAGPGRNCDRRLRRSGDYRDEGPFGDHTGYYTPVERFPAFHVTAITHRREPDLSGHRGRHSTDGRCMDGQSHRAPVPAADPHGHARGAGYQHAGRGRLSQPGDGRMQKRFPGHARKVMHGLWGLGLLTLAKRLWWWMSGSMCRTSRRWHGRCWATSIGPRLLLTQGPVDQLDHASLPALYGGKIGIDATAKWPEEGYTRGWPEVARMSPAVQMQTVRFARVASATRPCTACWQPKTAA